LLVAEGNISHTAQQEVDWAPPKSDNSLTLLPDLFYASFPEPLPTSADAIPVEGVSIEMGAVSVCPTCQSSLALEARIMGSLCDAAQHLSAQTVLVSSAHCRGLHAESVTRRDWLPCGHIACA